MAATFRDILEACSRGEAGEVLRFIRTLVNVNKKDIYGRTLIHQAAFYGQTHIVKLLLDHGANIHEKNNDGETPIHRAAGEGHTDTVKCLISAGAEPYIADNNGQTARDSDMTG